MSDSPQTSAPMAKRGRALVLKNTCRNASSTSVKKHLSWSPDIHPTARWVPSTPHRSRPAGYPPTRQPGAVGAKERECNVGHYVEADDEEETRPSAAVPPSVRGAITSTRARPRPSTTGPVARPVRLPRRSTPHHRGCARRQDRDDESAPRAQPEGRPRRPLSRHHRTPVPVSAPRRRAAREARFPVGSARPLHRRAAAKMSPRIRTGPEAVLTAHAPTPSAAAATARRKPDQVPIPEQNFLHT